MVSVGVKVAMTATAGRAPAAHAGGDAVGEASGDGGGRVDVVPVEAPMEVP